jgi:hypothetical protein
MGSQRSAWMSASSDAGVLASANDFSATGANERIVTANLRALA